MSDFCEDLFAGDVIAGPMRLPVGMLIFFLLQLMEGVVILTYLRRQRRFAALGDFAASKRLVLPVYHAALWTLVVLNLLLAACFAFLPVSLVEDDTPIWAW